MGNEVIIDDQRKVRLVIDSLGSGPKLEILRILLSEGPLPATEVSRRLGIKLSTTLSHLEELVNSGLVAIKSEGKIKKYYVPSSRVIIVLDLSSFVGKVVEAQGEEYEVKSLALEYMRIKRERRGKLPLRPKVRDVANILGLDLEKAMKVVEYINTHQKELAEYLINEVKETLSRGGQLSIKELSDKLRVHPYWIVMCIEILESRGEVKVRESKVSLLRVEK